MDDSIIIECYVDTNLIETIAPPARRGGKQGYNHQMGCGTVARRMQQKNSNGFALGIIDKDKRVLDYLKEFSEIISLGSLILHRHQNPAMHHYIIQICPAMEQFILENAAAVGISLADFGLPSELDELKKVSKQRTSKNDPRFRKLFQELHRKGTPGFLRLAAWVDYLKTHTFYVDIDELKGLE